MYKILDVQADDWMNRLVQVCLGFIPPFWLQHSAPWSQSRGCCTQEVWAACVGRGTSLLVLCLRLLTSLVSPYCPPAWAPLLKHVAHAPWAESHYYFFATCAQIQIKNRSQSYEQIMISPPNQGHYGWVSFSLFLGTHSLRFTCCCCFILDWCGLSGSAQQQ